MELTLKINGKDKVFKSKKITFAMFRKSTEYLSRLGKDFFQEDYPMSDLDESVEFICEYFGCSKEQFENGFEMEDSTDFFSLFRAVLSNIQLNEGKRNIELDDEGKS